jgi:hypothetical protein
VKYLLGQFRRTSLENGAIRITQSAPLSEGSTLCGG